MTRHKTYLVLILLFSLLFIAIVLLGAYFVKNGSKAYGVATFLFAFGAAFGQLGCLALYLRCSMQQQKQPEKP